MDFGHVRVVIDYSSGRVRCLIPAVPGPSTAPRASWGSTEHPAGLTIPRAGRSPMAAAALAVVLAVNAAGRKATAMRRLTATLRTVTSRAVLPATLQQAEHAVLAVRRAAWFSPARTACLEESAAAVLLLAVRRRSVVWCHGVAPDPVRLHAWVQTVDGTPVAEPLSTLLHTPVLTIGDTRA
ncbi:lasso peptide biosynthesis B2 protein [Streptomyces sp. NPDC059783]|uniref:lasso peptide biosynthesis B2 protein n=1 Tax=Streptomyces sp. NPDC059783 TaxID=3346944 RepID=UPI003664F3FC